jgi:hypothetical protein
MRLEQPDLETAENATAADLARALAGRRRDEDWYLSLQGDDGDLIEASWRDDGTYDLDLKESGRYSSAVRSVDERTLSAVLNSYLAADGKWRDAVEWRLRPGRRPDAGTAPSRQVAGPVARVVPLTVLAAILFGTGLLFSGKLLRMVGANDYVNTHPWWFAQLLALAFAGIVIAAIAVRLVAVRRAAHWPSTPGRIVRSGTMAQTVTHADAPSSIRNVADVAYEYTVGGRTYRGSRIGVAGSTGGPDVAATLARYHVGALVTVFYDPADPKNAVLERGFMGSGGAGDRTPEVAALNPPDRLMRGLAGLVLLAGMVASAWTFFAPQHLQPLLPAGGDAKSLAGFLFLGLFTLALFMANILTVVPAARWPVINGVVAVSTIENMRDGHITESPGLRFWAPVVEYAYEVGGHQYRGRRIWLEMTRAGKQSWAMRFAARYPVGMSVAVHYDPSDPGNAALNVASSYSWLLLALALVLAGVALVFGGFL